MNEKQSKCFQRFGKTGQYAEEAYFLESMMRYRDAETGEVMHNETAISAFDYRIALLICTYVPQ